MDDALTLTALIEAGFSKNTTGVVSATKRGGAWFETSDEVFRTRVRQFALGLYRLGVRRGDRVALHAENSTEWLIVDLAAWSLGAVTVPIYTTQPADQIRYILDDAEATVYVVSTAELFEALRPNLHEITSLKATVGLFGRYYEAMHVFEEVLGFGRVEADEAPRRYAELRAAVAPSDLATLVYTSGTTGVPKGVMLTHRNLAANALAVLERFPFEIEAHRGERMLSFLPLSHVLERIGSLVYLHIGYPIYFVEDPKELAADLKKVRPVHFLTVPRVLEKIHAGIHEKAHDLTGLAQSLMTWALDLADTYDVEATPGFAERLERGLADRLVYRKFRAAMGGRLRAITSGGAALAPQIMNFFNAIGILCGQGYGMTEAAPVISVYKHDQLRAGSSGPPLSNVEVRIADDSEILARGPNVMPGYYNLPEATAEVLDPDGWLHTGDIGHLDDDGHLWITDRKKQLFKLSTGKYVAPGPVEMALGASPFIEQVVVLGSERKFCAALIVPDDAIVRHHLDLDAAPHDLVHHADVLALIQDEVDAANEGRPHWEQVKKFALLDAPFTIEGGELTPTLKVKRRVIYDKYASQIADLYA